MKVLLLSDVNSPHTQKWAISLKKKGIEIGIFSLTAPYTNNLLNSFEINIFYTPKSKSKLNPETSLSKISYLSKLLYLKKIIKKFSPDIINAHYISSYGLLASLCGFQPLVLSVWGSDIISFPKKSIFHKKIIHFVLKKASVICVTSRYLQKEVAKYTTKKSFVIPFGVDTDLFQPLKEVKKVNGLVIGTAKSLEKIYRIDLVIKVFAKLYKKYSYKNLQLLIVGDGSQRKLLEQLVQALGISEKVVFKGRCSIVEMPALYNQMDLLINISQSESFGVAILEASACEKCVIATNVGGLPEVVDHKKTGFLIDTENVENNLIDVIENIIQNPEICSMMGKNGRKKVINEYSLNVCTEKYLTIYKNLLSTQNTKH